MKKILKFTAFAAMVLFLFFLGTLLADKYALRNNVIRLHVVANSDNSGDQKIKMEVKDAVVAYINEQLLAKISSEQNVRIPQIQAVLKLIEDGGTVPFIARYRKEATGALDEEQIRKINAKKVIISVFILLFIALCGTIYYLTTPVFNIASIEVYGNEKNSVETYISLSKIDINSTNIFAITESRINKNIKENAYVEQVTIKRKLPNILQINVTERKVAYQIKYLDNYLYIDSQGHILEISEEKKDVPYIEGFSTFEESINVGQRLIEEDLIKLNVVAKFMNYCKYNSIENKITNIDVADDTNYIIYFKEDKKTLYIGDASNLSERLSMLKTILKNEEKKKIEIFMNGDLNKDDVYIRYIED